MKIMSNLQYNAIVDIVAGQKKRIEEMEDKLDDMRSQRDRLQQLLQLYLEAGAASAAGSASNIDFPNSQKGGFEGSNIFEL